MANGDGNGDSVGITRRGGTLTLFIGSGVAAALLGGVFTFILQQVTVPTQLSEQAAEIASIIAAHARGEHNILDYTLSDTIRRWSAARRWLAPVAVGTTAMLIWHFFAQTNPPG